MDNWCHVWIHDLQVRIQVKKSRLFSHFQPLHVALHPRLCSYLQFFHPLRPIQRIIGTRQCRLWNPHCRGRADYLLLSLLSLTESSQLVPVPSDLAAILEINTQHLSGPCLLFDDYG